MLYFVVFIGSNFYLVYCLVIASLRDKVHHLMYVFDCTVMYYCV